MAGKKRAKRKPVVNPHASNSPNNKTNPCAMLCENFQKSAAALCVKYKNVAQLDGRRYLEQNNILCVTGCSIYYHMSSSPRPRLSPAPAA